MTTTTKNGAKGTQGVNGSQTKTAEVTPATNGTTVATATEKTTPVASNIPKGIEEQMKFYDGLSVLVKKKRVLEKHKEALAGLELPDEVHDKFSNANNGNITITISDCNGDEYEIINPKLVQETRNFLTQIVDTEIQSCDHKIMTYGN